MSHTRFILIDGLAALISVPFFVWLGYHFAGHIHSVLSWIEKIKHILLPVVLVVGAGALLIYMVRRRRRTAAVENV
jgi:membrane protein DedA with SNARE-associated domain